MQVEQTSQSEQPTKKSIYAWRHCTKCKSNYAMNALICVHCYRNLTARPQGYILTWDCAKSLVTKCGPALPLNLKRYNVDMPFLFETDLKSCVDCVQAQKTYCKNFGKAYEYNEENGTYSAFLCKASEFNSCPCQACCMKHKKANREGQNRVVRTNVGVTVSAKA